MNSEPAQHKTQGLWAIHLMMLLAAVLVSTSFTVGKAIAAGMDPAALTLIRFMVAALLFLPFIRYRYGLQLPDTHALLRYCLISFALTGFFWLMFISLRSTTALNTGVIFTLVPGISSLYSAVLLRERLGRYRIMAMIPATVGAIWVLFHGSLERLLAFDLMPGDLFFFCGCLLMAFYTPLVKLLHRGESMAVMTFWILITGCGWLLIFSGHRLAAVPWTTISLQVWAGIVYLAVFCTIITFFLSQLATLYLGPTRVMAYSYLYPPFILILDWLSGHQTPPVQILPGVCLIVIAMLVVQQGSKEKSSNNHQDPARTLRRT